MSIQVRTSNDNWFAIAQKLYHKKQAFIFIDDAGLGITEEDLKTGRSFIHAAKSKGGVSWQQITVVLAGIGITGVGVWIIKAALADPEPTTKLGLMVAGGLIVTVTGSLAILASLGVNFSVSAKMPQGYEFKVQPT